MSMSPKEFTDLFFDWAMQQDTGDLHVLLAASTEFDGGIKVSTLIGTPDHDSRCLDEAIIRLIVRMDAHREVSGGVSRHVRADNGTGEIEDLMEPKDGSQSH